MSNGRGYIVGLAVCALTLSVSTSGASPVRDLGVDVSHYQDASGIPQSDWNQMASEGKTFAFIKASEGLTGADDPTMATNVANATAAGILNGVYHFAHPENRPTVTGAVQEADHFVTYAGSAISPGHLRPVLDLETGSGLGATALTDWVVAFENEVIAQRGADAAPIIYTSVSYANLLDSRVANYDLWLLDQSNPADPNTAQPPTFAPYASATGSFNNWSFWQYSVGAAGGISPIDLDVTHSEYKSLSSFIIVPEPGVEATIALLGGMIGWRLWPRRR